MPCVGAYCILLKRFRVPYIIFILILIASRRVLNPVRRTVSRSLLKIMLSLGVALATLYLYEKIALVVRDEVQSSRPFPAIVTELPYKAETVSFRTADGILLAGSYSPSRNGATIILLHGSQGSRKQLEDIAVLLIKAGYGVLSYDTRAHGESEGVVIGYGKEEVKDLAAALDWLETRAPRNEKIGAYGFSMGAFILALYAPQDIRLQSLALASAPRSAETLAVDNDGRGFRGLISGHIRLLTDEILGVRAWNLEILKTLPYISPRPILLLGGSEDKAVPEQRLHEIFAAAHEPKAFVVFPGAGHGDYVQKNKEAFETALLAHFQKTLLDHAANLNL